MKTQRPTWLSVVIVFGLALVAWGGSFASTGSSASLDAANSYPDRVFLSVPDGCSELIANGGFEWDGSWEMPITPYSAYITSARAFAGSRSLHTGIDSGADVYSYSAANQLVTIPASAPSVSLDFAWYPYSEEGTYASAAALAPLTSEQLRQLADGTLPQGILTADLQYVLILNSAGDVINQVIWTRSDARAWQQRSVDVTLYRGQSIRVAFGTFNNGNGQRTAMYVDQVSVRVCSSPPGSTATPTPTVNPALRRGRLPLVMRNAHAPAAPTPSGPSDERWLRSLAVAPGTPGRLVGLTNQGHLMASADLAASWTTLTLPSSIDGAPLRYRGFVGMAYQAPQNIYLGATWMGLWGTTDGGASWSQRSALQVGPVSVSLTQHTDLWAGMLRWEDLSNRVGFSTDAGAHWSARGDGVSGEPVSPILIDPQNSQVVYMVTQGSSGGGTLYRNIGAGWHAVPNAPIGALPSGGPGIGLALNGGTRGLYIGSADGRLYVSYNAFTAHPEDVTWQLVHAFSPAYYPIPLAIGGATSGGEIYLTLYEWSTGRGWTMRSLDGGANWSPLSIPVPYLPGEPPTPSVGCYEALSNGGFESDAGWAIKDNPVLASYVSSWPVHSGYRSMRTGIPYGGANTLSYSPIEQTFTFSSVGGQWSQLRFWHYNVYGDSAAAGAQQAEALDIAALPKTEAELASVPLAGDFFYVIVIRSDGTLDWLHVQRLNTSGWTESVVNAAAYAGKTVRLQFGTYNDGYGGVSRTYIDDASFRICH